MEAERWDCGWRQGIRKRGRDVEGIVDSSRGLKASRSRGGMTGDYVDAM